MTLCIVVVVATRENIAQASDCKWLKFIRWRKEERKKILDKRKILQWTLQCHRSEKEYEIKWLENLLKYIDIYILEFVSKKKSGETEFFFSPLFYKATLLEEGKGRKW